MFCYLFKWKLKLNRNYVNHSFVDTSLWDTGHKPSFLDSKFVYKLKV